MGSPYIGEIRMFAGNFAPVGWALCDGSQITISENQPLFDLIGTTYGGDGQTSFNLPDLRGRIPIEAGNNYVLGESGGVESVTLTTQSIPSHNHIFMATTNNGSNASPSNAVLAQVSATQQIYANQSPDVSMSANAIGSAGGSQPHENRQPFLCINFIISLFGIFPQQS